MTTFLDKKFEVSSFSSYLLEQGSHTYDISAISISLNGLILASGDTSGAIKVWEAKFQNVCKQTFYFHTDKVVDLKVSSDGSIVASIGKDKKLLVYNIESQLQIYSYQSLNIQQKLALSPDAKFVASFDSSRIQVYSTWKKLVVGSNFGESDRQLCSLTFSENGEMIAFGDNKGSVDIASSNTLEILKVVKSNIACEITSLYFAYGNEEIMYGNIQGYIFGNHLQDEARKFQEKYSESEVTNIVISTQGNTIVFSNTQGELIETKCGAQKLINRYSFNKYQEDQNTPYLSAFSKNAFFYILSKKQEINFIRKDQYEQVSTNLFKHVPKVGEHLLKISPSGKQVLVFIEDFSYIQVWDTTNRQLILKKEIDSTLKPQGFLAAENKVVFTSKDSIVIWDIEQNEYFTRILHRDNISNSALSSNSQNLICFQNWGNRILIHDILRNSQTSFIQMPGCSYEFIDMKISQNLKLLLTQQKNNELILWDIHTRKVIKTLNTGKQSIQEFFFCDKKLIIRLKNCNGILAYDLSLQKFCCKRKFAIDLFSCISYLPIGRLFLEGIQNQLRMYKLQSVQHFWEQQLSNIKSIKTIDFCRNKIILGTREQSIAICSLNFSDK